MGVGGTCQHAVGLFCLPQLQSKEKEHCICLSAMKRLGTSSPGKQVARSSTQYTYSLEYVCVYVLHNLQIVLHKLKIHIMHPCMQIDMKSAIV